MADPIYYDKALTFPKQAPETQVESPQQSADPFAAMGGGVQIAGGGWVPKNHPLAQQAAPQPAAPAAPGAAPAAAPGAPPITTAGQATNTTATVGAQPAQGAPTTIAQSFQQALVNRLNPAAVNAQNPAIAPAIEANKLAEQRGFERNRNLLAEQAAKSGTDASGGFNAQLLGLGQDRAAREGQFAGNAVQHLGDQQNANLMAALGLGGNFLQGQSSQDLQKQLADLDAQLRREGLGAQTSLGNADIALRGRLGEGQLNLGLLSALLNNDQFGQSLAQNGAQFGASLDQNGLLGILGLL